MRNNLILLCQSFKVGEVETNRLDLSLDIMDRVFTRKAATDVSYLACIKKILEARDVFYPQFATHNAYSLAAVLEMAGDYRDFEFQCLHGMGYSLYDHVVGKNNLDIPCRVYAPVGTHEDLLSYLVRRLLENGANTSFVNRIVNEAHPISEILADPVEKMRHLKSKPHPKIPLPKNLYQPDRLNSAGIDFTNYDELKLLDQGLEKAKNQSYYAAPLIAGKIYEDKQKQIPVHSPSDHDFIIGQLTHAPEHLIETALETAEKAAKTWGNTSVELVSLPLFTS